MPAFAFGDNNRFYLPTLSHFSYLLAHDFFSKSKFISGLERVISGLSFFHMGLNTEGKTVTP